MLNLEQVRQFLYYEARLLDDRQWDEWLSCYSPQVVYWMPAWGDDDQLTPAWEAGHDPAAPNAVIMSVVLHPDYQGQGLSTQMMQAFIAHLRQQGKTAIYLMCKAQYLEMYKRFGYQFLKRSDSTHGGEEWFEMMQTL